MTEEFIPVRPATSSYIDWTGTAVAENSMMKDSGDLHELAGLTRGDWSVMAIDIDAYSHGAEPVWDISVYAFDREKWNVKSFDDLKALEARRGSVPVRHIKLHGIGINDVVKCMKLVGFQLISPNFTTLDIVERGDHPTQD